MVPVRIYYSVLAAAMAGLFCSFALKTASTDPVSVSNFGKQPAAAVDRSNNLHVVFGQGEEIFYTVSHDGGSTFSTPDKVGQQEKLALGNTRGPQIICTDDYAVIAAADHTGRIMVYRLKHGEKRWSEPVNILKGESSAKEGFIALAAGKQNQIYAAWLDLRVGNQNNIFSAYSTDGGKTWSENKLVYNAPEGKVCPCCRPSISADKKGNVYVMFRNELKGARDLYMAHSKDGGKTFGSAQKLGRGTWLLDRCPMDGGAVSADANGRIATTWRRENIVYYAEPGEAERKVGEGRAPTLVRNTKGNYLAWQQGDDIRVLTPDQLSAQTLGRGAFPRLASLGDRVVCLWESEGKIVAKRVP